ncbi:MAG: TonB-dependent receptor family protein [Bacteroidales bacterium]|jgi:outer membrane receptor protein involved in Fe transport|nr:TonB-dependent receptor family protein [Bacteroidales bacterium]
MNRHLIFTLLILFAGAQCMFAQKGKKINVTGQVTELNTNHPIEYATVALYSNTDKLITGGITDNNGIFNIEVSDKDIYLKVSYIGYKPEVIKEYSFNKGVINFNTISLSPAVEEIDAVEVRAEKSKTVFKLDKRVFNVGQDLVSVGGTALDILNNVPSVDVSIEGTISLRGNSSVKILINGKPSVMASSKTLGTITADMIERVEVVTNPSAKYDAEGTTGIINIILKKEDKKGINGAVTLNGGLPKNYSVGVSLNRRTEKFNLFSQIGIGDRKFPSDSKSISIDRKKPNANKLISLSDNEKNEQFYNFILGTDYHINKYNMLTLTGHYGYEIEDEYSTTDYNVTSPDDLLVSSSRRKEETEATNPKWQYELNYDKKFKDNKKHRLSASATGSFFGKDKSSVFNNSGDTQLQSVIKQRSNSEYSNAEYVFKVDYTHPFSEKNTLEAGGKVDIENVTNDMLMEDYVNSAWVNNVNYTNYFEYTRTISALYTTYAYDGKKFGVKAGLRLEDTRRNTDLREGNIENSKNYTHLFPSIHTSYKFSDRLSVQTGYSRRIRRPHMRDVNPFASYRDNLNIEVGNPNIKPTFTDAFELTMINIFNRGSVNASLFYSHSTDVVSDIVEVNGNTTITKPENIGDSNRVGIELNGKYEPWKWLTFTGQGNYMYYTRKGEYNNKSFDISSKFWSGRATTKIKLPADFDTEFKIRYYSDSKGIQGTYKASYYADLAIRKKLMKGRTVINFSVKDLFNSRKRVTESDLPDFYYYNEHNRVGRMFVVGVSFGFGKGEAMEYSGHKMF